MLKNLLIGTALLSTSLVSQASIISVINGADMAGIEVTATFGNGGTETITWAATSADSGGAFANDWSLFLSGETFGDYDPATQSFFGLWELTNTSAANGIVGLEINAGIADVYFDDEETIEHTTGSDVGRPFDSSDIINTAATFTDVYSAPDLFGTLNIDWALGTSLAVNNTYLFQTDTDKVTVSEPATALAFITGLLALVNIRRKS